MSRSDSVTPSAPPTRDGAGPPRSRLLRLVELGHALQRHTPTRWWARVLRPKGNLTKTELRVLGLVALLPLFTIVIRVLALPGAIPGFGGFVPDAIRTVGNALNQTFSLTAVPADQRDHILYLLFLPTCALLVALARLTFGIRVLGFRSILIAVGFHQSGILPSLFLITVVVATIVLVRPWLRRIRLPYYARVSVILCIVAMTMVGGVLAGPWMRSDLLWGVAYFPVIVLGMLAEGIARTLDQDNMIIASWRALTTIVLAFLIAILCQIPALRGIMLQFPELALTQIVAIVMIAEFLDLRLFQDWDTKVAGIALPKLLSNAGAYRVAVVRNRLHTGVIGRLGRPSPQKDARRSVQSVVDALRASGHTVRVLEGDTSLLKELSQFMPPNPRTGEPGGIVLNLAHGIQGSGRPTHVPAMLEMSGVAYTGPTPLGLARSLDKAVTKVLLQQAGIPTAPFHLMMSPKDVTHRLRYPLLVRPRHEPSYRSRVVTDRQQLKDAVRFMVRRYGQEALVEEHIAGRQIHVALLGNDPVECLPLVEVEEGKGRRICPAKLDARLAARIRDRALAAFAACGCRDYARVDIRLGPSGEPSVLEVRSLGLLGESGSFARAGAAAGYNFQQLVGRLIDVARARYLSRVVVRPVVPEPKRDESVETHRAFT